MIAITQKLQYELINYPSNLPNLIPNDFFLFLIGSKLGLEDTDFHQTKTLTSTGMALKWL